LEQRPDVGRRETAARHVLTVAPACGRTPSAASWPAVPRTERAQATSANSSAGARRTTPVVIGQPQAPPTKLPPEEAVLGDKIADHLPVSPIQPAREAGEQQLEHRRVDHGGSLYHRARFGGSQFIGRDVGHFGRRQAGSRNVLTNVIPVRFEFRWGRQSKRVPDVQSHAAATL
jgi:hypothetical protein